MRVLVVAHFAAIPSYLHKIAIDVDDSADSLFLLPEHTLSDFEQSGLGWMHDSRTITYFGKFREPMLTSGTHTNFVGARSIFFISLCRTKSVSLSSQAMVTPLQAVRMIVLGTSALLRLLPGATGRKNALKGVTNDVLYQLSYCGGPKSLSSENASSGMSVSRRRVPPDIGQCPILQDEDATPVAAAREPNSATPAGQESAPSAGLTLRRQAPLGKFVRIQRVIDAGVVRRPHDRDHRRNGRRCALVGLRNIGAGAKQGRRCCANRFGGGRRRGDGKS
jgi:hypothetical protein